MNDVIEMHMPYLCENTFKVNNESNCSKEYRTLNQRKNRHKIEEHSAARHTWKERRVYQNEKQRSEFCLCLNTIQTNKNCCTV